MQSRRVSCRSANGPATVTVAPDGDGDKANSGVDTSAAQTFTITVTAVNDAPSFTKGADKTVLKDAAAQSVTAWATNLSESPADEAGQTLNFIVCHSNTNLGTAPASKSATSATS